MRLITERRQNDRLKTLLPAMPLLRWLVSTVAKGPAV